MPFSHPLHLLRLSGFGAALFLALLVSVGCAEEAVEASPAGAYITAIVLTADAREQPLIATNGAGLYAWSVERASWIEITPAGSGRKWYALEAHPENADLVLAGGEETGLWISEDRGGNWSRIEEAPSTILDLAFAPRERTHLYVLAPDGVYRVEAGAGARENHPLFNYLEWQETNRRPDWPDGPWSFTRFQKITVDPFDPDTLLLGARWEGGFFRSGDGGENWEHERVNGIFRRVDELRVDPFDGGHYYAFTHHQGLFRSFNRGKSWVAAGAGLEPQIRTPHYAVYLLGGVAFSQSEPGLIFSGSDYSNWISRDHGETWSEVGKTLTCEFVRATAIHPVDPAVLYAGSNVGVFVSHNGGATWLPQNRGLPEKVVMQSEEVVLDGVRYSYVLVRGIPAVYRKRLDGESEYRPMGWLLYERGASLAWDPAREVLTLTTGKGEEIVSRDGGFRWSTAAVVPAPREVFAPDVVLDPIEGGPEVVITGAVPPDDGPLLDLYKRPPYVSIQLVTTGYPEDRSEPFWETNWEGALTGRLDLPEEIETEGRVLYVEVRDFIDGVRVGRAPYSGPVAVIRIPVRPLPGPVWETP